MVTINEKLMTIITPRKTILRRTRSQRMSLDAGNRPINFGKSIVKAYWPKRVNKYPWRRNRGPVKKGFSFVFTFVSWGKFQQKILKYRRGENNWKETKELCGGVNDPQHDNPKMSSFFRHVALFIFVFGKKFLTLFICYFCCFNSKSKFIVEKQSKNETFS